MKQKSKKNLKGEVRSIRLDVGGIKLVSGRLNVSQYRAL